MCLLGSTGCKRQDAGPDHDSHQATPAEPSFEQSFAEGPRPNIILLLIDALRADHLGLYGHPGGGTPNIDALGAEGVIFEGAIAPSSWTQPSVASVFCSQYPGVHKVRDFRQAVRQTNLGEPKVAVFDDSFITIAERLQRHGYATAAFVSNPFILREFGFAQGFDHFDASQTGNDVPGSVINAAAVEWLSKRKGSQPFFLFLHYMDVHGPYSMNPEFLDELLDAVETQPDKRKLTDDEIIRLGYLKAMSGELKDIERHKRLRAYREYWRARYEAGVREIDHHLGSLRSKLAEMDLWDEAYVIVTADHGEQLCERGFWDHGLSTYNTELHVPLLLRWPGQLPAGQRVAQTVRLIDLGPTLFEQLQLPPAAEAQGASLLPYLDGTGQTSRQFAFAESMKNPPEQKAIYLGQWTMKVNFKTGRHELYNLAEDAGERNDLADQLPEQLLALQILLERQLKENQQMSRGLEVQHVPLTAEQLERLRSLGYVGD